MAVQFTDPALEDLRRLGPALARRAVEQVALLGRDADAGDELVPGCGYRKLFGPGGALRVVTAGSGDTVTVWAVWVDGVRSTGATYAEALRRMQSADTPEAVEHAQLLERLGRLTGTVPVPWQRAREPVPDWLADALVERGRADRLELVAMDAPTAFARWNTRDDDA